MTKKRKLEKTRISNYEVLCIVRECTSEEKAEFIKKIEELVLLGDLNVKSEIKKLAYSIEKIETAEYLLLNFKADHAKITEIEEVLKKPLVIRHITINLDTEKKIRIKKSDKLQKNRKFKKTGFKTNNRSPESISKEASQVNENRPEVEAS